MTRIKKLLYASCNMGGLMLSQAIITWLMYYYAPPAGNPHGLVPLVPIYAIGLAVLIGRLVDAFADPFIGWWSDNVTTKWGRRLPFIAAGNLPMVICFIFLWHPPVNFVSALNTVHVIFFLSAFFFFFTVVLCPYLALIPEIVRTSAQRVNLSSWVAFMSFIGVAIGIAGSSFLIGITGFKTTAWILGLMAAIAMLGPLFVIREQKTDSQSAKLSFFEAISCTLQNRPFRYYITAQLFITLGMSMAQTAVPYIFTVLLGRSEKEIGLFLGVMMLTAIANLVTVNILSNIKGKKFTFILTMLCFIVILPLIYLLGTNTIPLSRFAQGMLFMFLLGFPLAGFIVLPFSLVADITDEDEKYTGKRREAMYYGMQGLITKTAVGIATVILAFLLRTFGYAPGAYLGIQLIGPISAVFVIIGLFAFMKYPIDT
ncbi:MFS transporter [Candidatus Margulisiibacteriota bacterium]